MERGEVCCYKTTGELVMILQSEDETGQVVVRRPVMTHENGIHHTVDTVYAVELENVQEHLRREAKEMVLKVKIQEEMQEEIDRVKKKPADVLVN